MTRDIAIPPYFVPGTAQIAPTTITFELVNALGQPITGLTSVSGIAGTKKVVATDAEQIIALEVNADIVPFSQWLITVTSGLIKQVVTVTLDADPAPSLGLSLPLAYLLYPTA